MSYESLLNYTRDIAANLSSENYFFHGRKEVLHEIHNQEIDSEDTVVWSLPFISSGSFTENAYQFNRSLTVNVIIYQKDEMGSEVDQNNPNITAPEIQVLQSTDALAEEFIRLFNFNEINATLQEVSEELEITDVTTDNVIKDNDWLLTGTLISITVNVPDEFDYCSTPAVDPITVLTVAPTPQNVTTGNPIADITVTTDNPATFIIDGLPSELTFTQTSQTGGTITGNAPAATTDFVVIAIGIGGGTLGKAVVLNVSASTPVTDLTYDNNNQSIWESVGTGEFDNMLPTTTPTDATGTYSGATPAGISLNTSTGEISVSDFSLIPNGANNFTITFTANGDFTGTPTFDVTINKESIWTPEDITAGQVTLQNWYDPTEDDADYLTITSGAVSQWDDRAGLYNVAQAGTSERPVPGTWKLDSKRSVLFFNDNLNNASVTSSNNFWVFVHFNINSITANQYFMRNTTNDIRLGVDREGTNSFRIFVRAGGVTGFINVPGGFDLLQQNNILSIHYDNTDVDVYVNGALLGSLTVGAHSGMSGNFQFWSFQDSTNALSAGGYSHEFLICDNSGTGLTTADQQRIEGYTAWKRNSQGSLDAGHPYKNDPPFN